MPKILNNCLATMAFLFGTNTALGQAVAPAPAGPPASDGGKFGDANAAISAGAQPNPAAPPTPAPQPQVDRSDEGHLRGGLSLNLGYFLSPGAVTAAPELRIGYQVNRSFGIFGIAGAVVGLGVSGGSNANGTSSASITGVSYTYIGVNAEAMFDDLYTLGGGLAVGKGGWASAGVATTSADASSAVLVAGGFMPQANVRAGFAFGSRSKITGSKTGLTLALDVRFLFAPNSVLEETKAGPNGGSVKVETSRSALGVNPMLVLGFDWR
jgi:hypothetical protein